MLALAHTLVTDDLVDRSFLDRYTVGYEIFEKYLVGSEDGTAKDADWAAPICTIPAADIRALARRMARGRTLVTVTWSLQRTDHGEQPVLGGPGSLGHAGPDRLARRRVRTRLRVHGRRGRHRPRTAAAYPRSGPEPGVDVYPCGPGGRHAASPPRAVRLRRGGLFLSRYPPRILGGRQPLPTTRT
jgi:biotin/methionine sulfoxide reductase